MFKGNTYFGDKPSFKVNASFTWLYCTTLVYSEHYTGPYCRQESGEKDSFKEKASFQEKTALQKIASKKNILSKCFINLTLYCTTVLRALEP